MKKNAHKIGAVIFILWGIVHVIGGLTMLTDLNMNGPVSTLKMLAPAIPISDIPEVTGKAVSSMIGFHSFNLVWFGILSVLIALTLNWKNSRVGFWINVAIIGFADIGLFAYLIAPGNMSFSDGLIGSVLFLLGLAFSAIGIMQTTKKSEPSL